MASAPGQLTGRAFKQFPDVGLDDAIADVTAQPLAALVEQQSGAGLNAVSAGQVDVPAQPGVRPS